MALAGRARTRSDSSAPRRSPPSGVRRQLERAPEVGGRLVQGVLVRRLQAGLAPAAHRRRQRAAVLEVAGDPLGLGGGDVREALRQGARDAQVVLAQHLLAKRATRGLLQQRVAQRVAARAGRHEDVLLDEPLAAPLQLGALDPAALQRGAHRFDR
ncbi:MAG TPA: hypothetical protein VNT54_05815 [Solirubrobacteraceae bacterium]|nr:hypothetical protein [Solirubrobacteraceae bacterium]